jgi:hypothetical protein
VILSLCGPFGYTRIGRSQVARMFSYRSPKIPPGSGCGSLPRNTFTTLLRCRQSTSPKPWERSVYAGAGRRSLTTEYSYSGRRWRNGALQTQGAWAHQELPKEPEPRMSTPFEVSPFRRSKIPHPDSPYKPRSVAPAGAEPSAAAFGWHALGVAKDGATERTAAGRPSCSRENTKPARRRFLSR